MDLTDIVELKSVLYSEKLRERNWAQVIKVKIAKPSSGKPSIGTKVQDPVYYIKATAHQFSGFALVPGSL